MNIIEFCQNLLYCQWGFWIGWMGDLEHWFDRCLVTVVFNTVVWTVWKRIFEPCVVWNLHNSKKYFQVDKTSCCCAFLEHARIFVGMKCKGPLLFDKVFFSVKIMLLCLKKVHRIRRKYTVPPHGTSVTLTPPRKRRRVAIRWN